MTRTSTAFAIGGVAALCCVALTTCRLEAQGPDYEQLHAVQEKSGTRVLYLVRRDGTVRALRPAVTRQIERDLSRDPRWREVAPEPEVQHLAAASVRKFEYLEPAAP